MDKMRSKQISLLLFPGQRIPRHQEHFFFQVCGQECVTLPVTLSRQTAVIKIDRHIRLRHPNSPRNAVQQFVYIFQTLSSLRFIQRVIIPADANSTVSLYLQREKAVVLHNLCLVSSFPFKIQFLSAAILVAEKNVVKMP